VYISVLNVRACVHACVRACVSVYVMHTCLSVSVHVCVCWYFLLQLILSLCHCTSLSIKHSTVLYFYPVLSDGLFPSTIFVGQIPYQATEEELKSNFPGCVSAKFSKPFAEPQRE